MGRFNHSRSMFHFRFCAAFVISAIPLACGAFAQPAFRVIEGVVRRADGTGFPNMPIAVTGSDSVSTDRNGYYFAVVPNVFSGTISTLPYTSPINRSFSALAEDQIA